MWGKSTESNIKPASMTPFAGHAEQERKAPSPAAAHAAPSARAGSASVGKSMRLRGELYSDEELYLDGEVEGTIEVRHRLTIGPNGKVKASVKARELVVSGSIHGNVEATERISIMTGASIVGDVKTAGIVIEDGAYFKGGIDILRPEVVKKPEAPSLIVPRAHSAGTL
jgi:cytoskeletal protein CcmA (bactofilin family)